MSSHGAQEKGDSQLNIEDLVALDSLARLRELADFTISFAVRTASALGIADHLAEGPRSVEQLATASGTNPDSLRRLLRALATRQVFREVEPDHFALTATAELLCSDHRYSLREAYRIAVKEISSWCALEYSLRTGRSAFEHVYGQDHRQYRRQCAEEDSRMDRAQGAATRIEVLTILRSYDWSKARLVVDVGGGTGTFIAALLSAFKEIRGILFDLPRMVEGAGAVLNEAGVADRCSIVGGDFFKSVPAGADVYVLKAVVGGWNDECALRILQNVRAAMGDESRLLVIEPILQYGENFTVGNIIHLQSLILYGGPDRTSENYEQLFAQAGLQTIRVTQRVTMPITELRPI